MKFNLQGELPSLTSKFHQSQHKLAVNTQGGQRDKSVFVSRVKRFHEEKSVSPGPGSYDSSFKQKHTYDYHVIKESSAKEGIAKQHQWIVNQGRLGFAMYQPQSSNLGPGKYERIDPNYDISHSGWSKGSRFDPPKKLLGENVGPGSYYNAQSPKQKDQKAKPLSVFMSKAPKTFFEQLIQKQRKSMKRTMYNPEQEAEEEAAEEMQLMRKDEVQHKKISHPSPMFKSKCERPSLINQRSSESIGPGSYQLRTVPVDNRTKGSTFHNLSPIRGNNTRTISVSSKTVPPGPGSYNIDSISISQKVSKKSPLGVIMKQQRFKPKSDSKKDTIPGPADYMQNRYTLIKQEDVRFKNKGSFVRRAEKKHDFGTAARSSLRQHNQNPFGEYNVNNYDVQYKVNKQKDYYERLRHMEVTLPAFNTKTHK